MTPAPLVATPCGDPLASLIATTPDGAAELAVRQAAHALHVDR
jgi:hypothetical protein